MDTAHGEEENPQVLGRTRAQNQNQNQQWCCHNVARTDQSQAQSLEDTDSSTPPGPEPLL